jgi:hypothetical protein
MKKASRRELSGIFDWFLPKKGRPSIFQSFGPPGTGPGEEPQQLPALPAPRGGGLIPRPETPPAPRPSMWQFAEPGLPAQIQREGERPSMFSFAPSSEATPPVPYAPPGPPVPREEPQQQALWAVFEPPGEQERPAAEFFRTFEPEEVSPPPPRWIPVGVPRPSVPLEGIWSFPSVGDMAAQIMRNVDLTKVFGDLERMRETTGFWQSLEANYKYGQPLMIPIQAVVFRELYSDLANFFGIPTSVFELYLGQASTPEEDAAAFNLMWKEVIAPLILVMQEAFEMLKPPTLPGLFTIGLDERTGEYWLYYVETLIPPMQRPRLTYGGPPGA